MFASLPPLTLSPINLLKSKRRNLESAGEDPFLSGQYAANFIQGFEHAKEASYPLQASTCCKHFVANELDKWNGTNRDHIDVYVPEQDLVDSYLPSFQTCVEEGKASGIMCSCESFALCVTSIYSLYVYRFLTRPLPPLPTSRAYSTLLQITLSTAFLRARMNGSLALSFATRGNSMAM